MDACFEYLDGEDSLATPDAKDEVDSLLHWRTESQIIMEVPLLINGPVNGQLIILLWTRARPWLV